MLLVTSSPTTSLSASQVKAREAVDELVEGVTRVADGLRHGRETSLQQRLLGHAEDEKRDVVVRPAALMGDGRLLDAAGDLLGVPATAAGQVAGEVEPRR